MEGRVYVRVRYEACGLDETDQEMSGVYSSTQAEYLVRTRSNSVLFHLINFYRNYRRCNGLALDLSTHMGS